MSRSRQPTPAVQDAARFEANLVEFIRSFGLLQPDRTPCGQPLHVSQAHALSIIAATPGISQHDLTVTLGLARATVSELISELCERGWVTRERADTDRRVQRLRLTDTGVTIAGQVADARRELMVGVLDALDPAERPTIIDAIGRLAISARHATARTTPSSHSTGQGRAS